MSPSEPVDAEQPPAPTASDEDLVRLVRFMELADVLTPYAIRTAIRLGVARTLAAGGATVAAAAAATGTHPGALASLLTVLAEADLAERHDDGTWHLTPTGTLMTNPDAEFYLALGGSAAAMDATWAHLDPTVRTGDAAYPLAHGTGFWDHLAGDAALGADFDGYMHRASHWMPLAATSPVWDDADTVVDVGGGDGRMLCELLAAHPDLSGTLVELPETAERAAARFAAHGLDAGRVTIIPGSFFDPLPPAADRYVLGHILHDWPDAESTAILTRVADAVGATGRLVVIDQVVHADTPTSTQARADLLMRVLFGAHERTRAQCESLAATAGLRVTDVHACDGVRSLIEMRAAI